MVFSSWLLEGLADGALWAGLGLCVLVLVVVVLCLVSPCRFMTWELPFVRGSI
jgi:uncharacterized RDD family membrane protein YckC